MPEIITGQTAAEDFQWCKETGSPDCSCSFCNGEIINPVAVVTQTETGEAMKFFCSEECAENYL